MRGLSLKFLSAMRKGLDRGRMHGYKGWDEHWENVCFPCPSDMFLKMRLHQEMDELIIALNERDPEKILNEAADVANFAMFLADINQP